MVQHPLEVVGGVGVVGVVGVVGFPIVGLGVGFGEGGIPVGGVGVVGPSLQVSRKQLFVPYWST